MKNKEYFASLARMVLNKDPEVIVLLEERLEELTAQGISGSVLIEIERAIGFISASLG